MMRAKTQPTNGDLKRTKAQLTEELETLRERLRDVESRSASNAQDVFSAHLLGILQVEDDAIVSTNEEFRITVFNKGAEKIFGWTFDEVVDRPINMLLPEVARESHTQHMERFSQGKVESRLKSERGEVAGIRKNGEIFSAEASISKIEVEGRKYFTVILRDITERKRAEEALQEKTFELNSILASLVDGVISICEKGRILTVNPAVERIFGYTEQELIGQNVKMLMPAPDLSKHDGYLKNHITTGVNKIIGQGREVSGRRKDGTEFPLDLAISETTSTANFRMFTGIVRDITDRKIAEEELTLSRSHLMSVFDNSPDVIVLKDLEGRYKIVNRRFEEWYGLSSDEVIGKTVHEFLPREVANNIADHDQEVIRTKQVIAKELELPISDGTMVMTHVSKFPVLDSDGQVVEVGTISIDITENRRLEERLHQSQQLLQTIFDSMPHLIFVRDTDSRYLMVNKALADRAGKKKEEIIGKRVTAISSALRIDRAEFLETDRKVMKSGEAYFGEEIVRESPNGEKLIERAMVAPFRNDKEEVIGVFGIVEDVTARRKTEEQLRRAHKMEAIGVLAGGIAHDFNNILQPILTFSDILLSENLGASEEKQYAERIFRSANRAKDLVAKILLYSRQSDGSKTTSDLSLVAKEVVELTRSAVPRSISIEFTTAENLPWVLCDPSQIHQVLLNLCVNASHAIGKFGEIRVELSSVELKGMPCVSGKELVGEFVRVAVSDNGVGIDEETLGKIFDPFFTTKGVGEGTGMGLSSALGIVQNSDGGIVVSTELGKGTTFEIFLPVFEGEQKESPGSQTGTGGTESILFVDDEEVIIEGLKIQLERSGYDVTAVSDSREALRVFRENPDRFALVITDLSMPKMNGDTLIQEIRKCDSEVPVILYTGLKEGLSSETVSVIGINAVLSKPLESEELKRAVREVLDGARETG